MRHVVLLMPDVYPESLLSRSPEVVFIFHTVGFILSGLAIAVLAWLAWRTGRRRAWLERLSPFVLLAASYGVGAWGSLRGLFEPAASGGPFFFVTSAFLETAALAALAHAVLGRRRGWIMWLAPLFELAGLAAGQPLVHPIAVIALTGLAVTGIVRAHRHELRYEWVGLLLIGLAHLPMALIPASFSVILWSGVAALRLLGVASLALSIERRSEDLFVQVFVRLNLTFIFLAGIVMLLASHAERSRRMDFAGREVEDLAEFIRGHVMYYLQEGSPVEDVLGSSLILREVVAEFGHSPDLRMVRVRVRDDELRVRIDDEGMIEQELVVGVRGETSPPASSAFIVADVPIYLDDEPVGQVVLEETAQSVNRDMAQSILFIFLAFTSAVTIASAIIGAIVHEASETIRQQVQKIEHSERRLMQAAKLASIGELVSGVAHEINNPLGVIVSRVEYLHEEAADSQVQEELAKDLQVIGTQAHRIGRIVRDLLDFARPHPLDVRAVEVDAILKSVRSLVEARLRQSGVTLETDIPEHLPAVRGDPDRLEQVLINLINNATDAMPEGGTICVRAGKIAEHVRLSVSDTGIGIEEDDLERIFDPFYSKKEGEGTGLGLSVSYGIIRDHRGEIWAESTPGAGSTFHILLPIAERDEGYEA
ncbi:MAG: hypothetical protein E2P02_11305 [Acidobacteria bacterium]|nr:MAG: hypothetical protein E2P02_11305 [Acidobacteriota bacterium]